MTQKATDDLPADKAGPEAVSLDSPVLIFLQDQKLGNETLPAPRGEDKDKNIRF